MAAYAFWIYLGSAASLCIGPKFWDRHPELAALVAILGMAALGFLVYDEMKRYF